MSAASREIVFVDSEPELDLENLVKKPKLWPLAVSLTPVSLPPIMKPLMEESDENSSESSPSNELFGSRNGADSAGFTVTLNGTTYNVLTPSEEVGMNTTNEYENSAPASDASPVESVQSTDIEELLPSELVGPSINGGKDIGNSAPERCVYEMRKYVKEYGPQQFLKRYLPDMVSSEVIIDLIVKLGYVPKNLPPTDSNHNYIKLMKLLYYAMSRVRNLRSRLEHFAAIPDVLRALQKAKKIVVITGAGVSTSLGIPDFRSSEGFYSKMSACGLSDPQEVFDISVFKSDPSIFYSIAHMLLPPENVKAPLHKFIRLLQDKGKLLRNYTQNIDNLEKNAGILLEKMVQCHGSINSATCVTCQFQTDGRLIYPAMRHMEIAYCPKCAKKRKQFMHRDDVVVDESFGVMKPDITFFGEDLPTRFHLLNHQDLKECDLLLSIGTSLRVSPVAGMPDKVPVNVPQILINKDPIPSCNFDVSLLGHCDDIVSYLCDQLGPEWAIDHPEYPKLLGDDHRNLQVYSTEERGVFYVRNKERLARTPACRKNRLRSPTL